MPEDFKDIALIESYLNNELSEAQRNSVENRRDQDQAFAQLLNDMEIMMEGTRMAYRNDIAAQLKRMEAELPAIPIEKKKDLKPKKEEPKTVGTLSRKRLWVYAAVLIPLIGGLMWLLWPKQTEHERLFAEYFEAPERIKQITRGEQSEVSMLKKQANTAYDNKNFEAAIPLYEKLYEVHRDTQSLFYLGISQLGEGKTDEAIRNFDVFDQISEDVRFEYIQFYIALAHLKKNNIIKALEILEKEKTHKAIELKNQLRKNKNTFK